MTTCPHHWYPSAAHKDHVHVHEECVLCGTRRVFASTKAKVMWDTAWLERRGQPVHETAGEHIVLMQKGR
jgi:ferredoxin-like protein FixX